jgi:hypothetical protein
LLVLVNELALVEIVVRVEAFAEVMLGIAANPVMLWADRQRLSVAAFLAESALANMSNLDGPSLAYNARLLRDPLHVVLVPRASLLAFTSAA